MRDLLRWTFRIQSLYYIASGALALVAMPLFLAITGPKTDLWLVRMVGLLAVTIGVSLGAAARQKRISADSIVLAIGAAASFTGIDVTYVVLHRISSVYLADAAVEIMLVSSICLALRGAQRDIEG